MGEVLRADNYLSSSNAESPHHDNVASWQYGEVTRPGFRENLDHFMRGREISQIELAARIGVTPGVVSRWLSKGHLPGAQDFMAIAKVLDVDPWLLIGSSFREPGPPRKVARPGRRPKDAELTHLLKIPSQIGPKVAATRPAKQRPLPTKNERE